MAIDPPRLFLADDDELSRELLHFLLESAALHLDSAEDGETALQRLSVTPYDLVLMDLNMPRLSGREVVRRLRDQPGPNRRVPVVALTAQTLGADRQELVAEGFTEVLYKPLEETRLKAIVARFCAFAVPLGPASRPQAVAGPWLRMLERTNGSASLARLMLEKLFEELPRQRQAIGDALQNGRYDVAQGLTHKLLGSAVYFGLDEVKTAADCLERLLLSGDTTAWTAAAAQLQRAVTAFLQQRAALMAEAEGFPAAPASPETPLRPAP